MAEEVLDKRPHIRRRRHNLRLAPGVAVKVCGLSSVRRWRAAL